jgi:hypothetical protein
MVTGRKQISCELKMSRNAARGRKMHFRHGQTLLPAGIAGIGFYPGPLDPLNPGTLTPTIRNLLLIIGGVKKYA